LASGIVSRLWPERRSGGWITHLMALAVRFKDLLREETVKNYTDLARLGGVDCHSGSKPQRGVLS
jgi:hypothetical protein